jgi:hypothetical protein
MRRVVEAELLDHLPPTDAQAIGSRADLRRLNFIMGHADHVAGTLRQHLERTAFRSQPLRLMELGAGDGTFLLSLARRLAEMGLTAEATLLDRQDLVSSETRRGFEAFNWSVETVAGDVFAWLEQSFPTVDVMLANLFLHHFSDKRLAALMRLASERTNFFVACEPRRSPLALTAARLLRLIGCNEITRHDALVSVRAGFAGRELSAQWPEIGKWRRSEYPAGLFSQLFTAKRNA